MLKRPRSHTLETISDAELRRIIPSEWVIRPLSEDYGIDYMVEIFDKESSTGKYFFVQLKGTDKECNNKSEVKYQIKIDHLKYYNSIPTPILFLIYSTPDELFRGVWTNGLLDAIHIPNNDQKTASIILNNSHIIRSGYFQNLTSIFALNITNKISLTVNAIVGDHEYCLRHLSNWIYKYFENEISTDLVPNPHHLKVSSRRSNGGDVLQYDYLNVTLDSERFETLNLIDYHLPVTDFKEVPHQFKDILINISLVFSKWNKAQSLELITLCLQDYKGDSLNAPNVLSIFTPTKDLNIISRYKELIKVIILNKRLDIFQFTQLSMVVDPSLKEIYIDSLRTVISEGEDTDQFGMYCYNLANALSGQNLFYESHMFYQKARKLSPWYRKMFYWWIGYGDVLYELGHFKIAESFYRKGSEDINVPDVAPYINWSIGDSLFFQLKFEEAIVEYKKYLALNGRPNVVVVRCFVASYFSLILNIEKYDSSIISELKTIFPILPTKPPKHLLDEPLNALSWFNYGVESWNGVNDQDALDAFMVVVALQPNDIEAWRNCFLLSFRSGSNSAAIMLLKITLDMFGASFINEVARWILGNDNMDRDSQKAIINEIRDMAKKIIETNDT